MKFRNDCGSLDTSPMTESRISSLSSEFHIKSRFKLKEMINSGNYLDIEATSSFNVLSSSPIKKSTSTYHKHNQSIDWTYNLLMNWNSISILHILWVLTICRMRSKNLDSPVTTQIDHDLQCSGTSQVTRLRHQSSRPSPSPVSVHDDCHVLRH